MPISGGGGADQKRVATLVSASQIGQITPGASATVLSGTGIFAGNTNTVDDSHTRDVNQLGRFYQAITSAVSGNNAGHSTVDQCFRMDQPSVSIFNIGVGSVANIRTFHGLITAVGTNFANCVDANTLGSTGMGFQFSTPRGDTNWQFIVFDGSTQTVVDTGVAASANTLYDFEIEIVSSSSVIWRVYSVAGVLLASGTVSSNLPASTTKFVVATSIETETTATKNLFTYSISGIGYGYVRT